MKQNMSSQELNEIFINSKQESDKLNFSLESIKKDLNKKMQIIKYENEFINNRISAINSGVNYDKHILTIDHAQISSHDSYGCQIHPKFKKNPIDIFNLKMTNGDTLFKDSLECSINGISKDLYKKIFMAENNKSKEIYFEEYKTNEIIFDITLDNTVSLGTSRFNTIEIDPYIHGAYDLMSIELYNLDPITEVISEEPIKVINGFENISRTRIVLEEKVKFSKVRMIFKNNFKTEINSEYIYPFGLKHIHFLESDFILDSSVIYELDNDKFIEYLYGDIKLYSCNGIIDTTFNEYKIEAYTDYDNNTLSGKIIPSSSSKVYRIAKNTKQIYIKVPLIKHNLLNKTNSYLSLNGIKLNYTDSQEIIL